MFVAFKLPPGLEAFRLEAFGPDSLAEAPGAEKLGAVFPAFVRGHKMLIEGKASGGETIEGDELKRVAGGVPLLCSVLAHPDMMREVIDLVLESPLQRCAPERGTFAPTTMPKHHSNRIQVGWRNVAMLRAVSNTIKAAVEDGEDGWHRLSLVLADEAGLYIPPEYAKVADAASRQSTSRTARLPGGAPSLNERKA